MKKISFLILLLIIGFTIFSACEKDDICVDGDTPLLVISFYDIDNKTEKKDAPLLRVGGVGNEFALNLLPNPNSETISDRVNIDSIAIPLNEAVNTSGFAFISNSADDDMDAESGNVDILSFTYENKDVFISRACGFVANYDNLSNELRADTDNWIKEIEIVNPLVKDETAAHVKIFH